MIFIWRQLMTKKICACCGQSFEPRPQVPNQSYCSDPACQQARRQLWQRNKMRTDPDYRENQRHSQRAWLDRHPQYWRNYRDANSQYSGRNQSRQRKKDEPRQDISLAKMDASDLLKRLPGLYRIALVTAANVVKDGSVIVELTPVCVDCLCKKDACKDRT